MTSSNYVTVWSMVRWIVRNGTGIPAAQQTLISALECAVITINQANLISETFSLDLHWTENEN